MNTFNIGSKKPLHSANIAPTTILHCIPFIFFITIHSFYNIAKRMSFITFITEYSFTSQHYTTLRSYRYIHNINFFKKLYRSRIDKKLAHNTFNHVECKQLPQF